MSISLESHAQIESFQHLWLYLVRIFVRRKILRTPGVGAAPRGFLSLRAGMKSASRSPIFGGVMLALIEGARIMLDRVAGGRSLQTLTEHLLSLPPAPITANYHHPQRFFSCSKYRMIFALRYRSSSAQAPPRYSWSVLLLLCRLWGLQLCQSLCHTRRISCSGASARSSSR
jgi:hypothetical protein